VSSKLFVLLNYGVVAEGKRAGNSDDAQQCVLWAREWGGGSEDCKQLAFGQGTNGLNYLARSLDMRPKVREHRTRCINLGGGRLKTPDQIVSRTPSQIFTMSLGDTDSPFTGPYLRLDICLFNSVSDHQT
jgi:hypothetical protein